MAPTEERLRGVGAPGARRILFALAVLAAALILSIEGLTPPAPKPADAPVTTFSGARARAVLARLVGDGVPHPLGSPQNAVVRSRVMQELSRLGYSPEIHSGFACNEYGICGTVNNVVAVVPGRQADSSVVLAAHYDSVGAGPGAFDDGAGAATVIEIARVLKASPQPLHSIILLIDDGEEPGLLGARVFADRDPLARSVRAAVNVDARGTSGPSFMFETGSANSSVLRLYARHASRPATSSIFYTVYKSMPQDTDFTVFKEAGWQGLNFANIGDVAHYHTRLDNFENASASTIEHHGENALPSILALANSDLSFPAESGAVARASLANEDVYFDVFERLTIHWPASQTFPASLVALILLFLEIGWLFWKKQLAPRAYLWGLAIWFSAIAATAALAITMLAVLRKTTALAADWIAYPLPLQIAFWSLALVVVATCGFLSSRRAGFAGLWAGVWTWLALLSAIVAWQAPQLSYVFLVPTCVAALAGIPFVIWPGKEARGTALGAVLPLAAFAVVGLPPAILFYAGLGAPAMPAISLLLALVLSPLIPIASDIEHLSGMPRIALPGTAIALTFLAAFGAVIVPPFSSKSPERLNLEYWRDADASKAQWIVAPASHRLPEAIRVASSFQFQRKGAFPWSASPAFVASAPDLSFAAPTFTILESSVSGEKRSYRTLLRSERGAPDAAVLFPPDSSVESVRVEGEPVQPQTERVRRWTNGWMNYECATMPAKGVEVSFTLPVGKPVEVYAVDESFGLPAEGAFLSKARPLTATPTSEGDVTFVTRRVKFLP